MRYLNFTLVVVATLALSVLGQATQQLDGKKAQPSGPAPPHDLSGLWYPSRGPAGGGRGAGAAGGEGGGFPPQSFPAKDFPFTAWGEKQFNDNRPSSGPREAPTTTNDRYLVCDPPGIPRIYFLPRPLEIAYIPGRTLIFYETNNTYREIWTDGRELPKDPDPWWYGHSVGKWVDDYTFVVESNGFNDKTWLDSNGHPHSDQMQLTERFRRLDRNTMDITFTVVDPKAYTKPLIGQPRTFQTKPQWELEESYCTVEDEQRYFNTVTLPAGNGGESKPDKTSPR